MLAAKWEYISGMPSEMLKCKLQGKGSVKNKIKNKVLTHYLASCQDVVLEGLRIGDTESLGDADACN